MQTLPVDHSGYVTAVVARLRSLMSNPDLLLSVVDVVLTLYTLLILVFGIHNLWKLPSHTHNAPEPVVFLISQQYQWNQTAGRREAGRSGAAFKLNSLVNTGFRHL